MCGCGHQRIKARVASAAELVRTGESMAKVNALVITGFGINCDHETAHAFELAGATARRVHLNDLIADPAQLSDAQILAVPGGFSFGDDVASGKILANRMRYKLGGTLQDFVKAGKLAIGICNGFQVLVKMGLLPLSFGEMKQQVTLTHNDSNRFEDRWVRVSVFDNSRCVWLTGIEKMELPIRHGEGKFVCDDNMVELLLKGGQVALQYVNTDGEPAQGAYPANPNGSLMDIAGICDPTGRIFGLMPHPEAFLHRLNHPRWTRENLPEAGDGLKIFQNAVDFATKNLAI